MRVLLTGAAGGMGFKALRQIAADGGDYEVIALDLDNERSRERLLPFEGQHRIRPRLGDLVDAAFTEDAVRGCDVVVHVAALVAPTADYYPKKAMEVNFGGTRNLVDAIKRTGQSDTTRFVYIGTVAETGDRMPPIHWGRVGDPIKPSIYDYYAVSKVAAERYVIESGLRYWVSLRQTGIIGPAMARIRDAIQFHNCLDNVLEYCSDRDSGRALRNLCAFMAEGTLDDDFWGHIYNIGGGESCRVSTREMYEEMYGQLGFRSLDEVIEPRYFTTRNFHGQYYLDSDELEDQLHFRSDDMGYFYDAYLKELGATLRVGRVMTRLPWGRKLMGSIIKKSFTPLLNSEHGTKHWLDQGMEDHIEAYWGSRESWEAIPEKYSEVQHFTDWGSVVTIDHGYDETKPESELALVDLQGAAIFRGGELLSTRMNVGDWTTKLRFRCAFGHRFEASPRLVLEGGHWCPECERTSWNYGRRAKVDPFFAQVWNPLHADDELREYPKLVTELDVFRRPACPVNRLQ
ncbi:MAG: NAD(P)-dependent oxidoreductase [Actinomyces ruminicola]|nr:NAD(P)-dependent oxidoreductase [Actinomyces ruminicola]